MSATTQRSLSAALHSADHSEPRGRAVAGKDRKAVADRELQIMRVFVFPDRDGHIEGWTSPFGRLEEILAS
jgi:hypothetical protein